VLRNAFQKRGKKRGNREEKRFATIIISFGGLNQGKRTSPEGRRPDLGDCRVSREEKKGEGISVIEPEERWGIILWERTRPRDG